MPRLRIQHQNNLAAMGRDYSLRIPKDGDLGMEQYLKNLVEEHFCGKHRHPCRPTVFYLQDIIIAHT